MDFYDLHVRSEFSEGESSIKEIAERAKLLGFKGICFSEYLKGGDQIEELEKEITKASKGVGIKVLLGFEARNSFELKKLVKTRRNYDILLARGSDLRFNRKAVETPEVDVLTHPERGRKDPGMNHVMAKLAAKNEVGIEINFREILVSSKATRSRVLHNMAENVKLCKKYKTPLIISSGAISHWQLRDPKILASMGCTLGLELGEAKKALSEIPLRIINKSKERRSEKWIRPGVKLK